MNVSTIPDIMKRFKVISGLSDHSLDNSAAVAAVTLGGSIIEKHLMISRSEGGPDSDFSLEPDEFKNLVEGIRAAEKSLGKVSYGVGMGESGNLIFRKSLFVVKDIKPGEKFTIENIRPIRPGQGLEPKYYEEILGKEAAVDIKRGMPLNWDMVKK